MTYYSNKISWLPLLLVLSVACGESADEACSDPAGCQSTGSPSATPGQADAGTALVDSGVATPVSQPPTPLSPVPMPSASDASVMAAPDAGAKDAMTPSTPVTPGEPVRGDKTCLQGTSADYRANGPYQVKMKDVTIGELGPYTIFYPSMMSADCPHPIVGWGNGTGVTGSGTYAHFFRHAATWGIVTIAAHNSNAGSMPFIAGGIDYLLKENLSSGSEFFGKLSTRAGSSGHSQGGFASITAASHPNIQAVVNVQGGGRVPKKAAMICLTGVEDFVRAQCTSSYTSATGPAFLADHTSADHTGTPTPLGARTPAGLEYIRMYTSWFRCWLGDDATACNLYKGAMAPVCTGGDWATCSGKNIP